MKFRFRGGKDCPDWLLGEINAMSKFSAQKISSMAHGLIELQINDKNISREEAWSKLQSIINKDEEMEEDNVKAISAALTYILFSASKFQVNGSILMTELQQLGLPKEHSSIILEIYSQKGSEIRQLLQTTDNDSLLFNRYVFDVELIKSGEVAIIGLDPHEPSLPVSLTPHAFHSLLKDLRTARDLMMKEEGCS
ncbi:COMM domain-containing protein 4 [Lepeophtheirus salmonis]|uniref:COMM domain-containing protein 4 n=1 Tax=Lepeophtheirus salmonis TaxID=72036 RepID=UPI001AE352DE|nr:COMM domain-containing protein 4-like [Lepeophtheirus salmonis]